MAENRELYIEIITPQKKTFEGNAQSVSLPGSLSPFQVLPKHAPIVSALDPGIVKIVDSNGKTILFAVASGFVEVKSDQVSILVESAQTKSDINIAEISGKILQDKANLIAAKNDDDLKAIALQIKFCEACLKVCDKS